MIDTKETIPDIEWSDKSPDWEREIVGIGNITAETRKRPDGSQITFSTLHAEDFDIRYYDLLLDDRFLDLGIETEPNGLLIDQIKTGEKWETSVGTKPEDWLAQKDDPVTPALAMIGFPATNTFWQKGGFMVEFGQVINLPDDETLTGSFEALTLTKNGGWKYQDIELVNAEPHQPLDDVFIGLSMPMILKNGILVPQNKIVARGDYRALADLRNFIDFSNGMSVQPGFNFRFFDLMRKFQPSTLAGARRLTFEGGSAVVRANIPAADAKEFAGIVKEFGLEKHFNVFEVGDENKPTRVEIRGPFPPNRIPVTVIGHDGEGKLVAGFFNGRQKDSTGVTFDETAHIMREKGAVNAGIGVAGGDVALILKTLEEAPPLYIGENRFEILNSPSNKKTRLAPNMLTIKAPDPSAGYM